MDGLLFVVALSAAITAPAGLAWWLAPRGGQVELFAAKLFGTGIGLLLVVALVAGLDALLWLLLPWYREHRP